MRVSEQLFERLHTRAREEGITFNLLMTRALETELGLPAGAGQVKALYSKPVWKCPVCAFQAPKQDVECPIHQRPVVEA